MAVDPVDSSQIPYSVLSGRQLGNLSDTLLLSKLTMDINETRATATHTCMLTLFKLA